MSSSRSSTSTTVSGYGSIDTVSSNTSIRSSNHTIVSMLSNVSKSSDDILSTQSELKTNKDLVLEADHSESAFEEIEIDNQVIEQVSIKLANCFKLDTFGAKEIKNFISDSIFKLKGIIISENRNVTIENRHLRKLNKRLEKTNSIEEKVLLDESQKYTIKRCLLKKDHIYQCAKNDVRVSIDRFNTQMGLLFQKLEQFHHDKKMGVLLILPQVDMDRQLKNSFYVISPAGLPGLARLYGPFKRLIDDYNKVIEYKIKRVVNKMCFDNKNCITNKTLKSQIKHFFIKEFIQRINPIIWEYMDSDEKLSDLKMTLESRIISINDFIRFITEIEEVEDTENFLHDVLFTLLNQENRINIADFLIRSGYIKEALDVIKEECGSYMERLKYKFKLPTKSELIGMVVYVIDYLSAKPGIITTREAAEQLITAGMSCANKLVGDDMLYLSMFAEGNGMDEEWLKELEIQLIMIYQQNISYGDSNSSPNFKRMTLDATISLNKYLFYKNSLSMMSEPSTKVVVLKPESDKAIALTIKLND
ncbi:MAG: hypothetical protein ABI597_01005 [Gammaproteobacteria bacterium]